MVVVVFRSRLRNSGAGDYATVAARMEALALAQPGFRSIKTFSADDGERVSIIEFASLADVDAWRGQREHVAAQRRGRADFYAEYSLQTCALVREAKFAKD